MKTVSILLFALLFSCASAQATGNRYSLLARDGGYFLKENASGKICHLVSVEVTLFMQSEVFKAKDADQVTKLLNLMKPKDKIFLDKIKPEPACLTLPPQVVIEII